MTSVEQPGPEGWSCGPFSWDAEGKLLYKDCKPLHMPRQSLQALVLLAAHAGEVVTREQLQATLWPEGTFVGYDDAINTIIGRLRRALGDDISDPRFIATVVGKGYRFIGHLKSMPPPAAAPPPARRNLRGHRRWSIAMLGGLILLGVGGWVHLRLQPVPSVTNTIAITRDADLDLPARPASDGAFLYYLERAGGHWNLIRSDGNPPDADIVATPLGNTRLLGVSPDHQQWLLGSFNERGAPMELWRRPAAGGAAVRVGSIMADDAVWSPDGRSIYYTSQRGLWRCADDGTGARRLAALAGTGDWLAWSPDGQRLRFTVAAREIWEWRPNSGARALPWPTDRCCGAWSRDGRYFIFSAQHAGTWNLWAQGVSTGWLAPLWPSLPPRVTQLTFGPYGSYGAYTGFADTLAYYSIQPVQFEAQRFDPGHRTFQPLAPGRAATEIDFSPVSGNIVFASEGVIWTAALGFRPNAQATGYRQLSAAGIEAADPRWSPDGHAIVYAAHVPGMTWRLYTAAANGGATHPVDVTDMGAFTDLESPDWSPDGVRLVTSLENNHLSGSNRYAIGIVSGSRLEIVPGSEGLSGARWSPDGHWLAAVSADQKRIEVYNLQTRVWRVVARGSVLLGPVWSRDGRYLYYQDVLTDGEPLERLATESWRGQRLAEFSKLLRGGVHRCAFMSLGPGDAPLMLFTRAGIQLNAATLNLP